METKTNREIRIIIEGQFACFTRPDLKVERVTYDIITPSAARNLIQAIYWHPGVDYQIKEIDLLAPIKYMQMTRNELKSKAISFKALSCYKTGEDMYIDPRDDIMQRSSIILKDVKYCIHFTVNMTKDAHPGDSIEKFKSILLRRLTKGQCYTQPYLGLKEFTANIKLLEFKDEVHPIPVNKNLSLMLYDLDYSNKEHIKPMYFFANLNEGRLDLRNVHILK